MDLSRPISPFLAYGIVWGAILLATLGAYLYVMHSRRVRQREAREGVGVRALKGECARPHQVEGWKHAVPPGRIGERILNR